jgi:hypothetical protein
MSDLFWTGESLGGAAMRTKLGALVAGLGLFCLTVPVVAHHGFETEYDANKKVSLAGVVTQVEWKNPHMRVYVDVTDASGKVTNWNLELTSPNTVQRQGWGKNDLKVGDKVVFEGYAGKVVESRASLLSITKAGDGRPLFVQGGPGAPNNPQ